jgi:hypothetical protein
MSGVRRAEHIYYKLERPYLFAVSAHSALPIVQISPNDSVGVLAPITRQPPPGIADELRRLEALPSLQLSDLPLAETAAHAVRVLGLQTQDPVLRGECFERADAMYRSILRACAHPSLTALAEDDAAKAMSTKLVVAAPVADLLAVPEDRRRLASHCLAGLSLCALMAQRDPLRCFGYASAAVNWDPHRPLELANMLRIQLLLTGIAYLGMVRVPDGAREAEFLFLDEMDATQVSILKVYLSMTELIVLPEVLRHCCAAMLLGEQRILPAARWERVRVCVLFSIVILLHSDSLPYRPTPWPSCSTSGRGSVGTPHWRSAAGATGVAARRPTAASSAAAASVCGCSTAARSARWRGGGGTRRGVNDLTWYLRHTCRVLAPCCTD